MTSVTIPCDRSTFRWGWHCSGIPASISVDRMPPHALGSVRRSHPRQQYPNSPRARTQHTPPHRTRSRSRLPSTPPRFRTRFRPLTGDHVFPHAKERVQAIQSRCLEKRVSTRTPHSPQPLRCSKISSMRNTPITLKCRNGKPLILVKIPLNLFAELVLALLDFATLYCDYPICPSPLPNNTL